MRVKDSQGRTYRCNPIIEGICKFELTMHQVEYHQHLSVYKASIIWYQVIVHDAFYVRPGVIPVLGDPVMPKCWLSKFSLSDIFEFFLVSSSAAHWSTFSTQGCIMDHNSLLGKPGVWSPEILRSKLSMYELKNRYIECTCSLGRLYKPVTSMLQVSSTTSFVGSNKLSWGMA